MFVIKDVNGDAGKFAAVAKAVVDKSDAAIVLMSDKVDVLKAGAEAAKDRKPVLYAATAANADAVGGLAKEMGLAVVAKADGYDALAELTTKLTGMGLKDIILDTGARTIKQVLQDNIAIRRAALTGPIQALRLPDHQPAL